MHYNNSYFTGFGWVTIKLKHSWYFRNDKFYIDIYLNDTNKISAHESTDFTSVYFIRIWKASTIITIRSENNQLESSRLIMVDNFVNTWFPATVTYEWTIKSDGRKCGTTSIDMIWQDERKEAPHGNPKDLTW